MFGKGLKPGSSAPEFDLLDESGARHTLADYRGRWLAVFFYPMDLTPVCVREACAFNDHWDSFKALGAEVLGCSTQDAASHRRMSAACRLRYPLLCDVDKAMRKAWNVCGLPGLRRATFLVDPSGTVRFVFRRQLDGEAHALRTLDFLKGASA